MHRITKLFESRSTESCHCNVVAFNLKITLTDMTRVGKCKGKYGAKQSIFLVFFIVSDNK